MCFISCKRLEYSTDAFILILPAMCDRWACIWCIHRNDSSKELEEWSWMFGYAMIGPSRILKLFYLSSVCVSHLFSWIKIHNHSKMLQKYVNFYWTIYSLRHLSIVVANHAINPNENTYLHETSKFVSIRYIYINTFTRTIKIFRLIHISYDLYEITPMVLYIWN